MAQGCGGDWLLARVHIALVEASDADSRIELRILARSRHRDVPYTLIITSEWGQEFRFSGNTPEEVWEEFTRRHIAEATP